MCKQNKSTFIGSLQKNSRVNKLVGFIYYVTRYIRLIVAISQLAVIHVKFAPINRCLIWKVRQRKDTMWDVPPENTKHEFISFSAPISKEICDSIGSEMRDIIIPARQKQKNTHIKSYWIISYRTSHICPPKNKSNNKNNLKRNERKTTRYHCESMR